MASKQYRQALGEWLVRASFRTREYTLLAGEAVFRQGDPASAMFLVASGRVRLLRHLTDGSTVTLHTASPQETFAEAAITADVYHCDALATVPTVITKFSMDEIRAHLIACPAAALAFAGLLADQVRELRARLENRSIRSAPQRLLAWMHLNAVGEPARVDLERSWTEIAAEIGLTREAVYRSLNHLTRSGAIKRTSRLSIQLI